jgi:ABC-2 type transport system ATP-binding protein
MLEIIQDENRAIIISSHILSDVEKIMNRAVILKKGRIICNCDFDELLERYIRVRINTKGEKLPDNLPFTDIVDSIQHDGHLVLTIRNTPEETIENLLQTLKCEVEIQPMSLEDIYRIEVS